jgi:hypothetical protein
LKWLIHPRLKALRMPNLPGFDSIKSSSEEVLAVLEAALGE